MTEIFSLCPEISLDLGIFLYRTFHSEEFRLDLGIFFLRTFDFSFLLSLELGLFAEVVFVTCEAFSHDLGIFLPEDF